jgi:hypothetical protein
MDITINIIEVASELAHKKLVNNWKESIQIYVDETDEIIIYTDEAQDIFNDYYDDYYDFLLNLKTN